MQLLCQVFFFSFFFFFFFLEILYEMYVFTLNRYAYWVSLPSRLKTRYHVRLKFSNYGNVINILIYTFWNNIYIVRGEKKIVVLELLRNVVLYTHTHTHKIFKYYTFCYVVNMRFPRIPCEPFPLGASCTRRTLPSSLAAWPRRSRTWPS